MFDILALCPSECPDVKNYKWRLNPVWYMMLYRRTRMATEGVKGLNTPIDWLISSYRSSRNHGNKMDWLTATGLSEVTWPPLFAEQCADDGHVRKSIRRRDANRSPGGTEGRGYLVDGRRLMRGRDNIIRRAIDHENTTLKGHTSHSL